jgi:multiple sugar transport system permease protein
MEQGAKLPLTASVEAVRSHTQRNLSWWTRVEPYLYLIPAVITVLVWVYRPLAQTLELSFYQWNLIPTSPRTWVGLENYIRVFTLPEMQRAVVNTLIYMVGILPLSVILPMTIAILTDNIHGRARNLYRALIFTPMIMAPVVISIIWRWILHPTNGVVNNTLDNLFNLDERIRFFTDGNLAIGTIIFITGWQLIGFSTLIFSAALANINKEYLEAAAIDGAGRWQTVRYIILPLLSPTILFMSMLTILLASQWTFAHINVLTQGGPLSATTNIYYLLWNYGFQSFAVGWSSAAAMVFFVGFGLIALVSLRLSNRLAFYDN